ncbi:hypothetical protein NSS92_14350 [Bacillus sp. FSL M8-0166]|uniref:hypothetical protein n=1 Tax=Bacillus sp. FSL M8-0166 TaxID=2954575 RepID=UPI0030FCBE55
MSQTYPHTLQPVEKKLSTSVICVKKMSIMDVDSLNMPEKYPHPCFEGLLGGKKD